MTEDHKSTRMAWIVWGLAVLFLFYEFFIRVFPSVIVKDLMFTFSVSASSIGNLSACYFYAYAPMQLPVGLLMDRYGARNLLAFSSLLCGIGALLFAVAYGISLAAVGRLLQGAGSAFGFVGMVYVCSHWFPKNKLALLVGIGNSLGMIGAMGAQGPLGYLVSIVGWRPTVWALAIFGGILAVVIFLVIKKEPKPDVPKGQVLGATKDLLGNLKEVARNPRTYLNAFIALLFYMTTAAFASLWGIPFLETAYGMSRGFAGFVISMIFFGWIVGGPIIGFISDKVGTRKKALMVSTLLCLFCLIPVIYVPNLPIIVLFVLLFLVGFFSSAELLNFTIAIEINPMKAKGTSISLTNMVIALGSSLMQPIIGILLDQRWTGKMVDGVPFYRLENFRFALSSFPIMLVVAFIRLFFLKEEKKPKKEEFFTDVIGRD